MKPILGSKHLWWVIPNELGGMPLPFLNEARLKSPAPAIGAYDDDLQSLSKIGVKSVIAALELPSQRQIFENSGFHYFSLKIPDGFPPTEEQAGRMLNFYDSSPRPLIVHCEAGVGRTGTLLAVLLLHRGLSADAAIQLVKQAMPLALENKRQLEFVQHFSNRASKK